ncbi:hypothetical protein BBP40_000854 [Aspergillus hancockii]|nr:hypothetical protein BBP40_000854 [Aspergillus hancockii]
MLDWLPHYFLTWRKKAEELHFKTKEVYTECCNIALGGDCWNWSHEASKRNEAEELPWEDVCYALGELYVAVANQFGMNMDETIFGNPAAFNPDRYFNNPDLPSPLSVLEEGYAQATASRDPVY